MPLAQEKLALQLLKPEFSVASSISRAMPHIHVTHPCAPDSPNGLDNPVFVVDDYRRQHPHSENESCDGSSFTTPTPDKGYAYLMSLQTQSLPVTPTPRAWDQLSFVSTPSHSISEVSSLMDAEKGLYIYEKIHAIVMSLSHRAQRVKERIMQPPTPSSMGSRRSITPTLEFANRHRFESFVTFASSLQSSSHHCNNDGIFAQESEEKSCWYKFVKSRLMPSRRKCIDPQSRLYILWLALVSVCYLYNSWSVVLRASFPYQTSENLYLWMVGDYTADFIYLIDLIIWKPHTMVLQDGFWISDPKKTSRIYWRSWIFMLDLLSLMPLDLFYIYFGFYPLFRLPRMLKINTFWEFFERFDRAAKLPHIIRILHTLSYMLFLIHVIACAYYAYSDYEGIGRPDNVWVYNGEGNAYVRCFLFATKIATSIGKNPTPTHEGEYIFMTFSWLSGVFIFAMLIGQIRDILSVASLNEEEYRRIMDRTLVYMKRLNLMKALHSRTRIWFNYNWQQQKSLDEHKYLRFLPHKMQMDIAMYVHFNILSKVELFQDFDRNLLRELVLKLKPYLYLPGDYICLQGEVGKEMYIVNYGIVEVMGGTNNDVVMATLIEGSVFGEISLLSLGFGNRRTADVRSKGFSNLFVLNKSDLHATIKDYPLAQDILRQRAKRLMKKAIPRVSLQGEVKSSQSSVCLSKPVTSQSNRTPTPKLIQTVLEVVPQESLTAHFLRHHSRTRSHYYPHSAPPRGPRVMVTTPTGPQTPDVVSDDMELTSLMPASINDTDRYCSSQPKSPKLAELKTLDKNLESDFPDSFDDPNRDYSNRPQSGALYDVEAYLQSGLTSHGEANESDSTSTHGTGQNFAECSVIIHHPSAKD